MTIQHPHQPARRLSLSPAAARALKRSALAGVILLVIGATPGCPRDPVNPPVQGPSNDFAQCVKETGSTQLATDKSNELNAQVSYALASGAGGATLKDTLIQQFQPIGDTCNQARIIELCYAAAMKTSPRPVTCDAGKADAPPALRQALENNPYDVGWSNTPLGTPDPTSAYHTLVNVRFLPDDTVVFACSRPTNNEFRATLSGRRLVGTWTDVEGHGEFDLLFDEALVRAEGWWNFGGQTQKYNLFIRRHR